jgi:hypothetical protein
LSYTYEKAAPVKSFSPAASWSSLICRAIIFSIKQQRFKAALFLSSFLKSPRPLFSRIGRQLASVYGEQFCAD